MNMLKKIFRPIVIALIAAIGLFFILSVLGKYKLKKAEEEVRRAEKEQIERMHQPFKDDKGGADTPQEALDAYKNALLEGEIEKALEYVFLEDRNDFRAELFKKNAKELRKYAEELPQSEELRYDEEESYYCRKPECAIKQKVTYHYSYWVGKGEKIILENEIIEIPEGKHGSWIRAVETLNGKWQLDEFPTK